MTIDFDDTKEPLRRITITGRLDIPGTDAIATKFAALAASMERRIILDLTGVDFLASIGIRAIISNAKAQQQRGGKLVLLVSRDSSVQKTLEITGIPDLIPMLTDAAEAEAAALA
jgi:anti-anti-sigma factor